MRAHHQIRVPVAARVVAVGADAADLRGQVDHELRPHVREQPLGVVPAGEVVVALPRHHRLDAVGAHPLDEVRAQEPPPPVTRTFLTPLTAFGSRPAEPGSAAGSRR